MEVITTKMDSDFSPCPNEVVSSTVVFKVDHRMWRFFFSLFRQLILHKFHYNLEQLTETNGTILFAWFRLRCRNTLTDNTGHTLASQAVWSYYLYFTRWFIYQSTANS